MANTTTLTGLTWEQYEALPLMERAPYFRENGRPYHCLIAQQFDRAQLDALGALATKIRRIAKTEEGMKFLQSQLSHKRAMLYFSQPSSRTFLSFTAACQILGIAIGEVRDTSTSSEFKGESKDDSVRTFSSYFDIIIMRSEVGGLAERTAWVLANSDRPMPVINAGSGKDQHPTQALLDIYTLHRSFEERGGIDGKTIVFTGDLLRGRTVRSLSWLLTNYKDVRQIFAAPKDLQISDDILAMLDKQKIRYSVTDDFKGTIPEADAIYMTRIQDEWDKEEGGGKKKREIGAYSFDGQDLKRLKKDAVLLHPLPRRGEISTDVDHDPRAVYWRQMRNGMWIRVALIATIFNREGMIHAYAEQKEIVV
jgi:aspartate carbamoyltransferase catalytic subunit